MFFKFKICLLGGIFMVEDQLKIKVRGEDGYRTFSIRIKDSTFQGIEDISKRTGHSRNELIGLMLDYALPRIQIESE